jgi:hypothetical protein
MGFVFMQGRRLLFHDCPQLWLVFFLLGRRYRCFDGLCYLGWRLFRWLYALPRQADNFLHRCGVELELPEIVRPLKMPACKKIRKFADAICYGGMVGPHATYKLRV